MARAKPIEMWKGKPRFTYKDTRKCIYRRDRKTNKETRFRLDDGRKTK
jgi:hypothetical protein